MPTPIKTIGSTSVNNISSNYTVLNNDNYTTINGTPGASDITVTLPSAASNPGRVLTIIKTDSASGAVIVSRAGSDTINGATSIRLSSQYESITIICDSVTNTWRVSSPAYTSVFGYIHVATQVGYGSTNTTVRRFSSSPLVNLGRNDITYTDSATLGGSFAINSSGIYAITYSDSLGVVGNLGITLNSSQLNVSIAAISQANVLVIVSNSGNDQFACGSVTRYLSRGDVVRAQTDGSGATSSTARTNFHIQRIS
jgi:hypothetical protein